MTDLYYLDPMAGAPLKLKSRDPGGDGLIPAHDIAALPGTVEGDIGASKGFLASLLSAITGAVTTHLATLAGAVSAARMAVNVDSATQGKLDSIIAAQGAPATLYGGRTTVATAGTRVVLGSSQALTEGVELRGIDLNTGLVYPGNASVTSTTNGTRLGAKERMFVRCNNVNKVYIDAAVNGEGVTWIGW